MVWLGYLLARSILSIFIFPDTNDLSDHFRQDCAVTIFRILCLASIVWLYLEKYGKIEIAKRERRSRFLITTIAYALVFSTFLEQGLKSVTQLASWQLGLFIFNDLIVAMNEELSFRGFFLKAFTEKYGRFKAEWISIGLFTAMHIAYQPTYRLPIIFLYGMAYTRLRTLGASLLALIVIHWAIDVSVDTFYGGTYYVNPSITLSIGVLVIANLVLWTRPLEMREA